MKAEPDGRCPMSPWLTRIRTVIGHHWQPKPIDAPVVDPQLDRLTGAQRSAEVFRFSLLSLEFWFSPLGRLREWIRLNGRLSAILLIPAVLVLPLVTLILVQIAHWLALLVQIAGDLVIFPVLALLATGAVLVVVLILRSIAR